ncbi:hypothetical protein [Pseudomonas sp. M30-35]|uniref:hypothetical protein n=1 Tax=Pseudomonas sp. M30-35 TaxID=1981174 RepID=UPI000B3D37B5|nr:hypothetical protein [Pseudomonas sp. M30-35]ARU87463.1 hypothetical protein B9K09_05530 [Pseudomonas sp. M30-35]
MESKLPVPTDNIFKFYALFGLLLIIFSLSAVVYVTQSTNTLLFSSLVELGELKEQKEPRQSVQVRIAGLERLVEVGKSNRTFYNITLGLLLGVGGMISYYGFSCWHRIIQPVIDETQKVQLEIAKLQLMKLQAELQLSEEERQEE